MLQTMWAVAGFLKKLGGGGGGLDADTPVGTYEHNVISPTNAVCNIQFDSAGTTTLSAGVTGGPASNWLISGTGANFWVRWTNTSGTLSTGTAGTWQQMNTNRVFGVTFTNNNAGNKTCTGTVEFATDSGGSNVVGTGSITLVALVDI